MKAAEDTLCLTIFKTIDRFTMAERKVVHKRLEVQIFYVHRNFKLNSSLFHYQRVKRLE